MEEEMNSNRYAHCFAALFLLIAAVALGRFVLLSLVQYSYMDGEFPWWMQQKDYVHTKSDKQEIIFLGDSRMKAGIIPAELCGNAYNLAVGGGTTVEMYYSLGDYLKFHPKPEMVVMGFCIAHYVGEGCFTSRDLYFHFLPLKNQLEAQYIGYKKCGWGFPKFKEKVIDTFKYTLLFPQKYSASCVNSRFRRGEWNHSEYEKNAQNKGHMYFGMNERDGNFNGDAGINFIPDARNDFYMRKIIALCKNHEIPFFIEQLPMNTASWEKLQETNCYPSLKNYLNSLAQETGISVELAIPCYEPECFGDASHLNPRGAERFTAEIKAKYGL